MVSICGYLSFGVSIILCMRPGVRSSNADLSYVFHLGGREKKTQKQDTARGWRGVINSFTYRLQRQGGEDRYMRQHRSVFNSIEQTAIIIEITNEWNGALNEFWQDVDIISVGQLCWVHSECTSEILGLSTHDSDSSSDTLTWHKPLFQSLSCTDVLSWQCQCQRVDRHHRVSLSTLCRVSLSCTVCSSDLSLSQWVL